MRGGGLVLPAGLPDIRTARLPASYEAAREALAACTRIDECADWASKAEALASYARQAEDDTLRRYADRIQARAIRRCGELLKAIEARPGTRTDLQPDTGAHTRSDAAREAGLSKHQKDTALRVANVAPEVFEALVESDAPPTVTALADMGRTPRAPRPAPQPAPAAPAAPRPLVDLQGIPPEVFSRATQATGAMLEFAAVCARYDAREIARGVLPREIAAMRSAVAAIDAWLDTFIVHLPQQDAAR